MQHVRSLRFLAVLAFAASAAMSTFAIAVRQVVATVLRACRFVADFVAAVPAKFEAPSLRLLARPVELVQACAYALGLAKRERPRVRNQWRMCPST